MYSGNIEADMKDKQRELDEAMHEKNTFLCPICKERAAEDEWNYGYEICNDCFSDHQEDLNVKHRER
jgi:hypothetical protein